MSDNLVRLSVEALVLDRENDVPFVLLEDNHKLRVLPISIGPFEANAIIIMLKRIRMPRMLTHELFAHFMVENKFTVTKLVILGDREEEYKARLFYKRGRRKRLLELRPSDGIALALQFHSPIYAADNLLFPRESVLSRFISRSYVGTDEPVYIEKEKTERTLM